MIQIKPTAYGFDDNVEDDDDDYETNDAGDETKMFQLKTLMR